MSARPSGSQACAACKYQRRKCAPTCPLAPFFPPDHQKEFQNAHKLFGVSNLMKIIRNLTPCQKSEAMKSMIYQANARAQDPVGGCYRMIVILSRQLRHAESELALVLQQLDMCRSQANVNVNDPLMNIYNNHPMMIKDIVPEDYVDECEEIKPLFSVFNEKEQMVPFDSKEAVECRFVLLLIVVIIFLIIRSTLTN